MSNLHPKVIEALKDIQTAKSMAFVMSFLGLDEYTAMLVIDALAHIERGEEVPSSLFLVKNLMHTDFRFSDGIARIFDPIDGFVEI